MAPRKVRLAVDLVRGLPVAEAETRLKFLNKAAARPVLKLLQSAIANAEHNFKLDRAGLVVASITADGGPVLKRSRARAMGRGVIIRKRTTHINIVLSDGKGDSEKAVTAAVKKAAEKKAPAAKKPARKPAAKKAAAETNA